MSITLLQKDSFEFDPKAKRNTFNISGKIGIDCILFICIEHINKPLSIQERRNK